LTLQDIPDYSKKNIHGIKALDSDFILDQFAVIEKKVEKIIEDCKSHEATELELTKNIKSLEEELQGRIDAEKKIAQEKALIRSKIDNLLVRLDEFTEM
jgi:hypothetical protein